MAESRATGTPLDAFSETYDVLIQGIKATSDRTHRLSTALIEDAQQDQRERLQLAKRWVERPFDLPNLSASLVETVTRSQGRALAFASHGLLELADAQREFGEGFRRVMAANQDASRATVDAARNLVSRATDEPRSARPSAEAGADRATAGERKQIPDRRLPEKRPSERETTPGL